MRIKTIITSAALAALAGAGIFAAFPTDRANAEEPVATLYKNPQCGCCEDYAKYLDANGYEVKIVPTDDLSQIKRQQNVPEDLEACHTVLVDGYAIEGHVPVAFVNRLLAERPAVKGIALPGMPMGSPGMYGDKQAPFTVYAFGRGTPRVFATQ